MALSSGAVVALIVVFVILMRKSTGSDTTRAKKMDRTVLVREAKRRLAQDPRDAGAHEVVADAYFTERDFSNAYRHYQALVDLCATNADLDEFQVTLRHSLCAMNLKDYEEAYKGLMIARSMDDANFDVNYNLGVIEYERRNFPRAVALLKAANTLEPAHSTTYRYLGLSLSRTKSFSQASNALGTWLEATPDDKECLVALGQCHYNLKRYDLASRIFEHLRADPSHGPQSCLYSGTIHLNLKRYTSAITDFEIGLRHEGVKKELTLELRYRLAAALMKENQMDGAISQWRQIVATDAGFKDAKELADRYQELSANKHLHTYLMGSTNEFVNLCRKLVRLFSDDANVKIMDVALHQNEYVDILAEVR